MFHILHKFQRDTRLFLYIVYCTNFYPFILSQLQEFFILIPLLCYSSPSSSTSADVFSLAPTRSSPACYHHLTPTHAPQFLSYTSQVQNWSCHNVLRDRILPSPNVGSYRLKLCLLSCRLHQGVIPPSVRPPTWNPPRQLPHHLVLKHPQDPSLRKT